jgi:hypothetical protein
MRQVTAVIGPLETQGRPWGLPLKARCDWLKAPVSICILRASYEPFPAYMSYLLCAGAINSLWGWPLLLDS